MWRWGLSGASLGFSYWNGQSGEPNGGNEHCAALWHKAQDYRWGDWQCSGSADSGKEFRPLCQRDKIGGGNDRIVNEDEDE